MSQIIQAIKRGKRVHYFALSISTQCLLYLSDIILRNTLAHIQYMRAFCSVLGVCGDKRQKENGAVIEYTTRPDKTSN